MPRTKQRTAELRAHVLQVAVDLLAADGVAGFTTRRVASQAETSTPSVYELFGDKAGLVREVFFEGFRLLGQRLASAATRRPPRRPGGHAAATCGPSSASTPCWPRSCSPDRSPTSIRGTAELEAGAVVRELLVARVQRAIDAGILVGDPIDMAHVLLALTQGLAAQETAGWLGTSAASVDRRWALALTAVLDGMRAPPSPV